MSSARYAPLPNPRSDPADADREMHEAFQLDIEEDDEENVSETAPLTGRHPEEPSPPARPQLSLATSPTYDFEREYDYDYPPPGSPPDPAAARPNNYGNTNGVLPGTPVRPTVKKPSIFRRAVGVLLPQHYQRLPTESDAGNSRRVGGGMDNDGVFANVMAKPARNVQVRNEDGEVYMVPEETQSQLPPTYSEAQADAVPPYWETTIHAPSSLDPNADMIVDELPTGSIYLFLANIFISYFFQFIGFLFTYLLHTTHAAKYGSRVGLGLTLIQFGFYSRRQAEDDASDALPGPSWNETIHMMPGMGGEMNAGNSTMVVVQDYDVGSRDWVAFLLMTLGWFLLLSSLAGYYRVKRWESSIRSSSRPANRETEARPMMEFPTLFDAGIEDENAERRDTAAIDDPERRLAIEQDRRLLRDLRAVGMI